MSVYLVTFDTIKIHVYPLQGSKFKVFKFIDQKLYQFIMNTEFLTIGIGLNDCSCQNFAHLKTWFRQIVKQMLEVLKITVTKFSRINRYYKILFIFRKIQINTTKFTQR